jgi:hypothetical protein
MHNDRRRAGRTVVLRIEPLRVSSCRASMARGMGPEPLGPSLKRSLFYGSRGVLSSLTWSSSSSTLLNDTVSASTSRASTASSSRESCPSS